ncbi:TPA: glutamine-hydrolyzing GMP synthase [Clostridioides difficile]|uniref:glutamine-hydrolyzing GMP synthase n=1 Tax=Clostridioides difficile TaxID=1496 RepID=UPI00097FE7A1|nr:glutamine-hydrolyzing GMP synthase [Clostridioides difficile]AXU26184.1 GMP synthase [Clostridioides difficile]AXU29952.1 GMP synthase [Clostridioides difficile]AXU33740.1 GMP synthase [Clostridioides difficile]MCP8412157.1 glutamine-hydrolyzing GMP synthase [Clostridioides difficile]MDV9791405.1 glutamine-hydrolyzing GMP synthase [Clostridioides difficile]
MKHELVLVIDFGGQYNQLIARRVRENNVYCEILPCTASIERIKEKNPKGIIFTGGPNSAYLEDSPTISKEIFELGVPILGICYGIQIMSHVLGGVVRKGNKQEKEYGKTAITYGKSSLFEGITTNSVWMSHTDLIEKVPEGFTIVANTNDCPVAAMENVERNLYGVQFHPEVEHCLEGDKILTNFLYNICKVKGDWTTDSFIEDKIKELKEKIGDKKALCALSGGVDSSVAAVLIHKAIGDNLTCIFVDHGLLRKNEGNDVERIFREKFDINLIRVNAEDRFLSKLKGVSEPEAKRKIIGEEFIRVFEEESNKLGKMDFLVQGTIYPDVIESGHGNAANIKSHHNVGGIPEDVDFQEIVEPLRELFKDEVRKIGLELGIEEGLIFRHPFPGPGLGIRVIGDVTKEKCDILREADAVYMDELRKAGLYREIWQAFATLPDVKTVGVMGDERTYAYLVGLRAVTSSDGMTSDWYKMPYDVLERISNRIINEVDGVNRVVYDITSKPPGTIEWE